MDPLCRCERWSAFEPRSLLLPPTTSFIPPTQTRLACVTMRRVRDGVIQATPTKRGRGIWILVGRLVVAGLLVMGGIGYAVWWIGDNLDSPGPGATGTGPRSSADSVNVRLMFAAEVVEACTRDRPNCANQTISGGTASQTVSVSRFDLRNQLRSSSRRYILSIRLDGALPGESAQTVLR